MPSLIRNKWTLARILGVTYEAHSSRFESYERDIVKSSIQIKKTSVYDGKSPGESRTKYTIQSSSFPQYYPYYTKKDSRGRDRAYQRTYRHIYEVVIQLDTLSMSTPFKMRTGANKKYIFHPDPGYIKNKTNPYGKYLSVGDYNIVELGINPDFFFTQEWVRDWEGCLFGKNYTNGPPDKIRNSHRLPFCTKHEINCIVSLMNRGIFKLE